MILRIIAKSRLASVSVEIEADTIPEAFSQIPEKCADLGMALLNDGSVIEYSVRVLPRKDQTYIK